MSLHDFRYLPAVMALAVIPALCAQDTRNVTEPRFPQACVVLTARLSAEKGALSDASERTPDTARIQDAIDRCERGKAVELKPSGPSNIFLAGPLQLKPGVTLLVDGGAALFASRNPRDYDLAPGGCGIVTTGGGGCKPMITADRAPGSGIMGDVRARQRPLLQQIVELHHLRPVVGFARPEPQRAEEIRHEGGVIFLEPVFGQRADGGDGSYRSIGVRPHSP